MPRRLFRSILAASKTFCIYATLSAVFAFPASATLLGLSSGDSSNLYTIDSGTGAATLQVPITGAAGSFVGLESLGGILYATDMFVGELKFGTIDRTTGVFTPINNQGGSMNWHGLAGNESALLLYAIDQNDDTKLKTITPGGVITTVGPGSATNDGRGLAYDDANGILYAVAFDGNLYTVNTATGVSTLVGPTGITEILHIGLAYDEAFGILYANIADDNSLYTLDVTTGAATLIGSNAVGDLIDGLAWEGVRAAVPEPGSIGLLAVALAACAMTRRRRNTSQAVAGAIW